jgi:spermidine synthase
VLLLGLGGGSAARVVRAVAPGARIVAVEIDPRVVRLAREWFDLDALGVEVVVADAREYLTRARARFDAVLEDVFVGAGRAARKPEGLPLPGLARAARRVRPGGVLASNALDEWREVHAALRGLFPRVVRIDVADYDNRVFVAGAAPLSGRALRRRVAAEPVLAPTLRRLAFRSV